MPYRPSPARNRSRLVFKLRSAARHPRRVAPYGRRWLRNLRLRLRSRSHVEYYRGVMRSDAARDPRAAVGSRSDESWVRHGRLQFDYLVGHGLAPGMRMLEIGCGNLRAGRHFIAHLPVGSYHGIDISPEILIAALGTVRDFGLQSKLPHLSVVDDLTLSFLPDEAFDVVYAHSVFSHSPIEVIDQCLQHVGRILKHDGFFDFTFDRTEGAEHDVLGEDFYYRSDTLIRLAARYGLSATLLSDWEGLHPQSKIRVTRTGAPIAGGSALPQ
jgi:SAM-dependent methyltransferase